MRALIVALTLFAGPAGPAASSAPERSSAGSGAVALQWRGADVADEGLRLAAREAVAGLDGRPVEAVEDRALDRARVAVSREHPATVRALRSGLRARLDEADAAYREGRFDDARALLDALLDELRASPQVPGAAASAREAHLLAARIAWAAGETAAAEQALAAALRLDPEAKLSTRRAPPELVERHRALQVELLAAREHGWIAPTVIVDGEPRAPGASTDASVSVEIDGVSGLRPIPPGPHFVVVYRDGREPVAGWRELDQPWSAPAAAERISTDPDVEHEAACRALALELLVLAERRGARVGLQGYRCGVGYGPRWIGNREALGAGAATIAAGPFDASAATLAEPWPTNTPGPIDDGSEGPIDAPRPWYRRGWIWGTSVGVTAAIVGGVVAGVLLGGRRRSGPSLQVDADSFLGGL